jgi:hypothetical protein
MRYRMGQNPRYCQKTRISGVSARPRPHSHAFFNYDNEPIYVGQTNELVRTRIRRHLTNQRTDAVAMSVLDAFEVFTIKVYPLPEYQDVKKGGAKYKDAKKHLNALERMVHDKAIADSTFHAILNEKDPEPTDLKIELPVVCEGVKDSYGARFVRVRGHDKVFCHLMFGIMALAAEQLMRLVT